MSKFVSNSLLSSEIESSTSSREEMENNFGGPGGKMPEFNKMSGVPTIQAYDSIDAVVDLKVLLELLVIGLSLVFVSSLASMSSIQTWGKIIIKIN